MAHSCAWWVVSQGKESWISLRNSFQRRLKNRLSITFKTEGGSGLGKAEMGEEVFFFFFFSCLKGSGDRDGMTGPGQAISHG